MTKSNYANSMNWDDLKIILAVCRAGSLSGAARDLGSSHSTVFRQINAIEKKFATRFFDRLPHGYEMTEAGEAVLRVASSIEEDIIGLTRDLHGKDLRLQGKIRLTAPEGVSHYLLPKHLVSFYRKHPDIQIDLIITSSPLELARQEADIALRVTSKPPESTIGRKICQFSSAMYASKSYLTRAKNLSPHNYDLIMCEDGVNWLTPSIWKNKAKPNIVFSTDSTLGVVNAAKTNMGAAMLPCFIGDQEKKLQRVTPPIKDLNSELWILTHSDLRQTARVRALMKHLYSSLSEQKALIEGDLK